MSNGMHRVAALRQKLKDTFASWQDAYNDDRCRWINKDKNDFIEERIIRDIWDPGAPNAVSTPDPDLVGGDVVALLCKRFGV